MELGTSQQLAHRPLPMYNCRKRSAEFILKPTQQSLCSNIWVDKTMGKIKLEQVIKEEVVENTAVQSASTLNLPVDREMFVAMSTVSVKEEVEFMAQINPTKTDKESNTFRRIRIRDHVVQLRPDGVSSACGTCGRIYGKCERRCDYLCCGITKCLTCTTTASSERCQVLSASKEKLKSLKKLTVPDFCASKMKNNVWKCPMCPEKFLTRRALSVHKKKHSTTRQNKK